MNVQGNINATVPANITQSQITNRNGTRSGANDTQLSNVEASVKNLAQNTASNLSSLAEQFSYISDKEFLTNGGKILFGGGDSDTIWTKPNGDELSGKMTQVDGEIIFTDDATQLSTALKVDVSTETVTIEGQVYGWDKIPDDISSPPLPPSTTADLQAQFEFLPGKEYLTNDGNILFGLGDSDTTWSKPNGDVLTGNIAQVNGGIIFTDNTTQQSTAIQADLSTETITIEGQVYGWDNIPDDITSPPLPPSTAADLQAQFEFLPGKEYLTNDGNILFGLGDSDTTWSKPNGDVLAGNISANIGGEGLIFLPRDPTQQPTVFQADMSSETVTIEGQVYGWDKIPDGTPPITNSPTAPVPERFYNYLEQVTYLSEKEFLTADGGKISFTPPANFGETQTVTWTKPNGEAVTGSTRFSTPFNPPINELPNGSTLAILNEETQERTQFFVDVGNNLLHLDGHYYGWDSIPEVTEIMSQSIPTSSETQTTYDNLNGMVFGDRLIDPNLTLSFNDGGVSYQQGMKQDSGRYYIQNDNVFFQLTNRYEDTYAGPIEAEINLAEGKIDTVWQNLVVV